MLIWRRRLHTRIFADGVIASWVAQSEVAQYVQTAACYNKPYFIVWVNHSFMALMLPLQALWVATRRWWQWRHNSARLESHGRSHDEVGFDRNPLLVEAEVLHGGDDDDLAAGPFVEAEARLRPGSGAGPKPDRGGQGWRWQLLDWLGLAEGEQGGRCVVSSAETQAEASQLAEARDAQPWTVPSRACAGGAVRTDGSNGGTASMDRTFTFGPTPPLDRAAPGGRDGGGGGGGGGGGESGAAAAAPPPLTLRALLLRAAALSLIYTLGDWTWYIGLPHTSVAAGTCIFNSSCVFVYGFSVLFLGEKVSAERVAAVALAIGGVLMLALAPSSNGAAADDDAGGSACGADDDVAGPATSSAAGGGAALAGNLFVLLAAALYGLYEVLCEKFVFRGSSSPALANTLSGAIGVVNVLALWPLIPLLGTLPSGTVGDWVREPFAAPGGEALTFMMVNAVLALAFNVFFMLAIALTSPLMTSVGCMLTIPVSAVCDALLYGDSFPPLAIGGSVLVILGFALLTRADLREQRPPPGAGLHDTDAGTLSFSGSVGTGSAASEFDRERRSRSRSR
eukprot:g4997.t1